MINDAFINNLGIRIGVICRAFIVMVGLCVAYCVTAEPPSSEPASWLRHTIDGTSRGADGVRLADVNGDGLQDITTGWEEGGAVRVYLNPGPATGEREWPRVTVGLASSPEDAIFVDVDGDGVMDVISCTEGDTQTIWIHWAPDEPAYYLYPDLWKTEAIPATVNLTRWMFALPLQLDEKNGVDIIAGSKEPNAQIGWLEAPPNPRKVQDWRWHSLYRAGWIMSLLALDMDDDGDCDILASDRKGPSRGCLWLENPGHGETHHLPWAVHRIGSEDKEVMFLTYSDLDGDGENEIIAAISGQEVVIHHRPASPEQPWPRSIIPLPADAGTGKSVAIGDMDGNGRNDLVVTCENAKDRYGVFWLSYRGTLNEAEWSFHDISGKKDGVKYDLAELIDLDRDGDLDVLTCEERDNLGVIWYENPRH